jgi:PAS domain S-box-containing protein
MTTAADGVKILTLLFRYRMLPAMKLFRILFIFICMCGVFSAAAYPYEKPQSITVFLDDAYPPYIFKDQHGVLRGIIVDHWKLWEKRTGVAVELQAMDWAAAQESFNAGKADVIDTVFRTPEREKIYDFTAPYATLEVPVFFNKNISGISDIGSLAGFTIGVKKGDACISVLQRSGITTMLEFDGYEDLIRGAVSGQIKVFCADKPPALYYLFKLNAEKEFHYSFTLYTGQFHRAVRKGNHGILSLVDDGFSKINAKEKESIDRKWMGSELARSVDYRYFIYGGIIALVLLLNLAYINIILNRRIKKRTAQLQSTIGDLKVSETQKKAYVSAIPDLVFVIDREGRFLDYNTPSMDLLLFRPEDFLGKKMSELPFPESLIRDSAALISKTLSTRTISLYVYDMPLLDGIRIYEARIVPYSEDSVLWISRDITESVHKDEQLRQAQKMETIGNLAGGLAHDFNNVLGGIIGTTSLLKYSLADGSFDPAAVERDVSTIEEIAHRGAEIVNQLLSVSKRRDLMLGYVDLKTSVMQVISICRNTFDKSVSISSFFSDGPAFITADKTQIEQVILNLCVNGFHAMTSMRGVGEKMGGELTVRIETIRTGSDFHAVHHEAGERNFVSVTVTDTGIGMDAYVQSRVFEPFFTTKEAIRGTGLGLTMVQNIVQRHGGFIDVFSEPGKGSTFRVSFPAAETQPDLIEEKPDETVTRGEGAILIIDDEEIIRETASRILEYCGYTVELAQDGEQGIEVYKKIGGGISGVILDMSMPRMSGKDALAELRKINPEVKVLLASGYRDDPRVQECLDSGVSDFLQKPFTLSELAGKVYELVGKKKSPNNP